MRFDIITVFPHIFDSYLGESILKRAQKEKLITVRAHNLRDFTKGKQRQADDKPYGGGAGMVLMAEPILRAADAARKSDKKKNTKIVILSAKGKQFDQKMACDWAKKYERIIFVSGRYEGIDERAVKALRAEEISVGPYVLTDGDVAAMAAISAVARLIPGVINEASLKEESFKARLEMRSKANCLAFDGRSPGICRGGKFLKLEILRGEYPHYTRPDVLQYKGKKYRVPAVLMSGDHKKIAEWRRRRTR